MRKAFLISGFALLAAVWLGPLPQLARRAFFAHMTMHMAVVAVAAPLLALGISGRRFDPAGKFPAMFAPIPASILELLVVWVWHTPALHHAARHSTSMLVTEQAMFLLAGLLVWLSAFGAKGAGVLALLLTSMHMTLLGALLALTPRPLYEHVGAFLTLTAAEDQHLGGAIMLLVGGVAYLLGGLALTGGLLQKVGKA